MKVFLSWSGEKSRAVAMALRDWLPYINSEIQPWMFTDIEPGKRWAGEIANELQDTSFSIVCVTRDNQAEPWLNFEAGALAKQVDDSRVVPLTIDVRPSDVRQPLGGFQGKKMTKEGVLDVLESLNALCEHQVPNVAEACERNWSALQEKLDEIPESTETTPVRDPQDLLEEILTIVRSVQAETSPIRSSPAVRDAAAKMVQAQERRDDIARMIEALLPAGSTVIASGDLWTIRPTEHLPDGLIHEIQRLAADVGVDLGSVPAI